MANVLDYLLWRGDLTLEQSPFQDVDGFILTCLSYHFLTEVLKQYDAQPVTISELALRVKELPQEKLHIRDPQDVVLLQLMGKSPRFQNMAVCFYADHIDIEKEAQFSAITVLVGDGTFFVSYRGTDLSLIGWKEDFNMSFLDLVPAQTAAAAYLLYVAQRLLGKIRVGGHSKGGNLAVFASAVNPKEVQERIVCIYNHDGPGFQEGMLRFQGYRNILEKLHTFVPQSSIIGMLMNHQGEYTVVKSAEKGVMQHDPYSWEVMGADFIRLEAVSMESKFWNKTLKCWLKSLTPQKREKFVDALFELLSATHADEQGEVVLSTKNTLRTLQTLKDEDEETRDIIFEGLHLLWVAARKTAGDYGLALQRLAEVKLLEKKR
ncbi:Mbeg1-like protein [Anaerotignum sp.]|uniref:Mbeg1-like protein n=1 Tax=Anaerotignum sp. TaxID=2039241 RepID=UPI00289C96DA|nr:Mbeg1-like protein [Anaerotignum sp.]